MPSEAARDLPAASPEPSSVRSNGNSDRPPSTGAVVKKRKYDIAFKGVYACLVSGGNYWQAQISIHGNTHHLGVFSTPEEAARAYDEHARPLGRKLNFPDGVGPAAAAAPPATAAADAQRPPPSRMTPPASPRLATQPYVPAHLRGTTSTGALTWTNDLNDEKVAAFWRGARMIAGSQGPAGPARAASERRMCAATGAYRTACSLACPPSASPRSREWPPRAPAPLGLDRQATAPGGAAPPLARLVSASDSLQTLDTPAGSDGGIGQTTLVGLAVAADTRPAIDQAHAAARAGARVATRS